MCLATHTNLSHQNTHTTHTRTHIILHPYHFLSYRSHDCDPRLGWWLQPLPPTPSPTPKTQDAYWSAQGENDKSKAAKKREEEEKKKAELAAKKAEAKRLADAELEELAKTKARAEKAGSSKVRGGLGGLGGLGVGAGERAWRVCFGGFVCVGGDLGASGTPPWHSADLSL